MSEETRQWEKVESMFEAALALAASERDDWLKSTDADPEIVGKVRRMLHAHESSDFLDRPIESLAGDLIVDAAHARPAHQTSLGRYELVREIATGGMGSVYLAKRADGEFDHEVAIKILKPGAASATSKSRFVNERQILATLSHPNIARLLDGGISANGLPFIVMEYVQGVPITTYCIQNKCPLEHRLKLLLKVCEAVSHAHQKLIVHRDLKPSNILVTPEGRVKLLDFGIAKLLDEAGVDSPVTRTGFHMMTPEYATPEQVTGEPITTASDVYQLGLLLYELIAGDRPFELNNPSVTELAQVVCHEDPVKPSVAASKGASQAVRAQAAQRSISWAPRLKGDLDTIVMKALRKEPESRYVSIERLAGDIQDYLDGRPVGARSGSAAYRARKFVRRHVWQVGAAAVILMLLVGYAATITVQEVRTARERDRAERYASFLADLLGSPDPFGIEAEEDRTETTVATFLDRSIERVRRDLTSDPILQVDLMGTVGDVYTNLGARTKARQVLRETLTLADSIHGAEHPEVVELIRRLALATDDRRQADSLYVRQLSLTRAIEPSPGFLTAKSMVAYGKFLFESGRWQESDSVLALAMNLDREQFDPTHRALAAYYRGQANRLLDRLDRADSLLAIARQFTGQIYGDEHPYSALVITEIAAVREFKGDSAEARRLRLEAIDIFERKLGSTHPNTIMAYNNLAILLSKMGDSAAAEQIMKRVYTLQESRYGPDHDETISALQNLATFLLKQGSIDDAEPMFYDVARRYRQALPENHYLHAFPKLSLTELYLLKNEPSRAEVTALEALETLELAFPDGHPLVAVSQSRLGAALIRQNRFEEAETMLTLALHELVNAEGFTAFRDTTAHRLATVYEQTGRIKMADSLMSAIPNPF